MRVIAILSQVGEHLSRTALAKGRAKPAQRAIRVRGERIRITFHEAVHLSNNLLNDTRQSADRNQPSKTYMRYMPRTNDRQVSDAIVPGPTKESVIENTPN